MSEQLKFHSYPSERSPENRLFSPLSVDNNSIVTLQKLLISPDVNSVRSGYSITFGRR